ncbi:hypothetical protein D3C81_1240100 [compost metagenome]
MNLSNETLKRINEFLKAFNKTFEIEANIITDNEELIADGLKIKGLKGNGSDFVNITYDTFNSIVKSISEDHELIYDEKIGLAIAKKIVKTNYEIEEF